VLGSASPATSGTPRPPPVTVGAGTSKPCCQVGRGKTLLTPPPVAPPFGRSSQTVSLTIWSLEAWSVVPPQPSANVLDAGKSTWLLPSLTASVDPLSPEATHTLTPMAAADWKASSKLVSACGCPVGFGRAPADGNDRRLVSAVVNGGGDRVQEALIRVRCEIDDDLRGRGNRARDFDVEHDFAVGAVRSRRDCWCLHRPIRR
jgi:hypothetical protein